MLASFLLGLIYFLFAFTTSLLTIYLCFRVVIKITKYDDIALLNKNNIAVSIVLTCSFIAMAIMTKNALYPVNAVIQDFVFLSSKNNTEYVYLVVRSLGYLILTITLSMSSIASALIIFTKLTHDINEEQEIKNNNIAVGILLGGVLIAFALIIDSGISDFVNSLIPIKDL